MKTLIWFVLSFCIVSAQAQEYSYKSLKVDYAEHNQAAKEEMNYTYKNLRLYPIKASKDFLKANQGLGSKYTPLKEAITNKKVLITETEGGTNNTQTTNEQTNINTNNQVQNNEIQQVQQVQQQVINVSGSNSATVNTLFIENTSKDTIYIMAGEVVQGGRQDRVVAQDIVLAPNSGKVNLSVFCVEQGRWSYDSNDSNQNFDGYYGVSSVKLRSVVEKKQNQSQVWEEVERSNSKNKVNSGTSAYTAQMNSDEFNQEQKKYLSFFKDKFKNEKDVIGVVVVTGEKVVGCDIFASPDLFHNQFGSLLTSYVNEAITDGSAVKIKKDAVEKYMDNLLSNADSQEKILKEKGQSFKTGGKTLRISTY